jgi:endonuclease G
MSVMDQIARARARLDFDPKAAVTAIHGRTVADVNSAQAIADRRNFVEASVTHRLDGGSIFERVIAGNDLQPISYLERGAIAARAIARIKIMDSPGVQSGWGSGFLIAPGVLLTNHHVFPSAGQARHSFAQFDFESGLDDTLKIYQEFTIEPDRLFFAHEELDFAVVAVAPISRTDGRGLSEYGCLPLLDVPGKASVGEWLTIVQHPGGQPKQVCVRENRLLKRAADVLWYSTDTLGGSSGSPVFNNDWYVVALHHSGVPEMKNGKVQTTDGRDFDDSTMGEHDIKWIANEGIRASRIVQTLKVSALAAHPLLKPMFEATPATARVGSRMGLTAGLAAGATARTTARHTSSPARAGSSEQTRGDMAMNTGNNGTDSVMVRVDRDELIRAIRGTGGGAGEESATLAGLLDEAKRKKPRAAAFDAPFDPDYSKRKGYNPEFLGKDSHRVNLPTLGASLKASAAKLIDGNGEVVLKYYNYSVVMHAERRLAIYSAASVNFADRFKMSRPKDVWRTDPRIEAKHQLGNFYYASNNFDRGHLTRNEDMEYGKTRADALRSAADTCHWTNCTPQHSRFNQNEETWHGIELYLLEQTIKDSDFSAQIITGPVLDEGDPTYKGIQYPMQYWKVVAAVNGAGKLFATAYLASQQAAIDEFGIEAAPLEPFGAYWHFQVKIAEIERLTGLTFSSGRDTPLSEADPLARRRPRGGGGGGGGVRPRESGDVPMTLPTGYIELKSVEQIVMD